MVAASSLLDTGFRFGYFPNLAHRSTSWYVFAACNAIRIGSSESTTLATSAREGTGLLAGRRAAYGEGCRNRAAIDHCCMCASR